MTVVRNVTAAATAAALLVACSDGARRAAPTPRPVPPSLRPAFEVPRSPGPPLRTPEPYVAKAGPDVTVTTSLRPHYWVSVGDRMTLTVTLRNHGAAVRVPVFAGFPTGNLVFTAVTSPPGNRESMTCGGDAPEATADPHAGRCGPDGGEVSVDLGAGESRTLTWVVELDEIVCAARGDFQTQFFAGVMGGVRRGFGTYQELVWVANDAEDYAAARAKHPPAPGHVTPVCPR